MSAPVPAGVPIPAPMAAARSERLFASVVRTPQGLAAVTVLAILVLLAVCAPVVSRYAADFIESTAILVPPSADHWLGTDTIGRDIFARLLYGGQINLIGAALSLVVSIAIGVPTGLVAGYFGGRFDAMASWITNLVIAIPGIIVLLAVTAIVGPSVWVSMSVFGILLAPSFFRLVRTSVRAVRNELYVDAAKVSGLGNLRILSRHILYVVRGPLIVQSANVLGLAIGIQAGLEFLNLGDQTRPSWGGMLNQGFLNIYRAPGLLVGPVVVIAITTIALAVMANTLRDVLEESGPTPAQVERLRSTAVDRSTLAAHSDALLVIDGLTVAYPGAGGTAKVVVSDVSITVNRGEVVGLVGESGSGKSQTAFSVLGLLPDTGVIIDGTISFAGQRIDTLSKADYRKLRGEGIAYVPQEPLSNLTPSFKVGGQLTEPMRQHLGISRKEARTRVLALLDRVGIADPVRVFNSYPHEISGGMAQRVLIAGAVSCEPDLLIADEPTTALDVTVQAEVLDLLRDLQRERNMGVLVVTHNFGVVADLCDRVAVMQNGRIVEQAPVLDLFESPQHPYTRMLLASTLEGHTPRTTLLAGENV